MSTITDDIRESYADILSEEQIEETIEWWSEKEKQAFEQGRQAGLKEAMEIVKTVSPSKNIIRSDTFLDGFWDAKSRMMEALLKEAK